MLAAAPAAALFPAVTVNGRPGPGPGRGGDGRGAFRVHAPGAPDDPRGALPAVSPGAARIAVDAAALGTRFSLISRRGRRGDLRRRRRPCRCVSR
jgi:hypothetical protein